MKKAVITMLAALSLALTNVSAQQEDVGMLIFYHKVVIGMTFANVLASWGQPTGVSRDVRYGGASVEIWRYVRGSGDAVVEFETGQVVHISELPR